ncbi:Rha family transcriptional regulator [Blautia sp.]|uniref:Phage regulatory protein Rha (Phage_pRha) n=1 Tax=Blautia glucerasea TaxID=536633 RepID=A0A6N2RLR7_9FIRM
MNELVYLKNNEAVCDSLQVAEKFGKRHGNVMRTIESLKKGMLKIEETPQMFWKSFYIEEQNGQRYPKYIMNRDGFSLLIMGFTGKDALNWKLQYIKAFNQMESFIKEKSTQTWVETRKAGKLTRKAETDTIKKLVDYAKIQGSEHSEKLYMTYSKLANKMAGISKRDEATVMQLNNLSLIENIILHVIDTGILTGKHYKEIYQDCKKRLETVKDLAYLESA